MTTTDLLVDFPKEGRRNREHSRLQFADKLDVHIVERHEDAHKILRNELWYTKPEYNSMKRNIQEDRLEVIRKAQGGSFDYAGGNSSEGELCCIGIEHLLTRESMLHVRDCRVRCTYAVLAEQARQGSDELSVALASIGQTRVTARRAVALAKLHKGAAEKA